MKMPFGKHKHKQVKEIDTDYLLWLSRNADLWGDLADAVAFELLQRGHREFHDKRKKPFETNGNSGYSSEMAMEIIKKGYKTMAREMHPDLGGQTSDMQKLNTTMDVLRGKI